MTLDPSTEQAFSARPSAELIQQIRESVSSFIRGKDTVIDLALTCLLAEGHLLLDDVPGVGKTSLARSLAHSLGITWNRIQFTPDVLPSDVTGVSVFNQGSGGFEFHAGPVFASVVLADEINRATPRTQSALLEAMEEKTVTVDGTTHQLPSPFIVIATQNPVDMAGTYPLPEAQLDRFLMRASIGYPDQESEVSIVADHHAGKRVSELAPVISHAEVVALIASVNAIAVDPSILDYIVRIVAATRTVDGVSIGSSPRGSIAMLRAVRAWSLIQGRTYALPGDVQTLAEPVLAHRIVMDVDGETQGFTGASVVSHVLANVPAPQPN